jgi:hypothetical protein
VIGGDAADTPATISPYSGSGRRWVQISMLIVFFSLLSPAARRIASWRATKFMSSLTAASSRQHRTIRRRLVAKTA